eukprot:TRINITY_DN554_c0_g1_i1.p1 TRINITY_DN554_c0_g1~~TRINITY_DN554_c0_g1_i1.p1  ORF type:complete len:849 (+),score=135.63 TRINITY_DN554_c0_g1_i1:1312-3858(+)
MLCFIPSNAILPADHCRSASTFTGRRLPRSHALISPKSRSFSHSSVSIQCRANKFSSRNHGGSRRRPQSGEEMLASVSMSGTIKSLQEKLGKSPPEGKDKARSRKSESSNKPSNQHRSGVLKEELELFGLLDDEDAVLAPEHLDMETLRSDMDIEEPVDELDVSLDGLQEFKLYRDNFDSSPYRRSQLDPRESDPVDMRNRLERVKQRRKRLAAERGEEAMRTLIHVGNAGSESPSQRELSDDEIVRVERQNVQKALLFTLSRSRVIDVDAERANARGCELTVGIEDHLRENWRVPNVRRPFVGLHEAFMRVDNPPCPRCQRRTPVSNLQHVNNICDICFSEIYLQAPGGSIGTDINHGEEFWDKEEVRKEEARALGEVVSAVMGSRPEGTNAYSSQESKNKPLSSKTSGNDMGNNSTGDGKGGNYNPPVFMESSFGNEWNVHASDRSLRTINPIRNLVQNIDVKPNPDKELIRLSVGDPTVYGNLKVSEKAIAQFCEVIRSGKGNGYSMSMGSVEAREAVANRYSTEEAPLTADDVVLASGTSGALEIALGSIANEGDNVLLPKPGFPLFRTIAEGYGIECRYYRVNPDRQWEICLEDLPKLADSRTKAIVVNNPSNPCGSVFSESHIDDLLASAAVLKLPIIADEVYADMVFSNTKFTSIASRSRDVPVLTMGGISKQFVVPGWRLGWILIHDRAGIFTRGQVRKGIRQMTTRMLVPNTPAQAMIPSLLSEGTASKAFRAVMHELEMNAKFIAEKLKEIEGVRVVKPQGAMYLMAEIDVERLGLQDDMEFVKELLKEEAVFVLPGQCFQAERFIRIVFSAPREMLEEAVVRIGAFCERRIKALVNA